MPRQLIFRQIDVAAAAAAMFERRGEGGKPLHRPSLSGQDHAEDALLVAAERKELAARKFDEWVRFKDNFDRGLGLFAKLDPSHCEVRCACNASTTTVSTEEACGSLVKLPLRNRSYE